MSAPKVSVIVPTWNRASLLGTAIDSVLAQSFRDLEVVIVDDGSVNATEALVRRYRETDARVRYVSQQHRGISAAMNTGIRESRGQYIARIDSDDQWFPELLETEVAVLEARPEIGLVYSKGQWATRELTPLTDVIGHALHFPDDALRSMLWGDATCNITVVVRRECFDRAGLFDESLKASEDWDMWLRTSVYYRFFFVDRVLSLVRSHDDRATGDRSESFEGFLCQRCRVLDKFFARGDLAPEIVAMKTVAYRNLDVFEGNMWMGAGNPRHAFGAFARAVRAGGSPLETMARIVWFSLVARALGKMTVGRRLMAWDSARRRRSRTMAPPR